MRKSLNINQGWIFRYHDGTETALDLPHTWNALDGQDGGGDYWRGTCTYKKELLRTGIWCGRMCLSGLCGRECFRQGHFERPDRHDP